MTRGFLKADEIEHETWQSRIETRAFRTVSPANAELH